jgi:hypothetical protein
MSATCVAGMGQPDSGSDQCVSISEYSTRATGAGKERTEESQASPVRQYDSTADVAPQVVEDRDNRPKVPAETIEVPQARGAGRAVRHVADAYARYGMDDDAGHVKSSDGAQVPRCAGGRSAQTVSQMLFRPERRGRR